MIAIFISGLVVFGILNHWIWAAIGLLLSAYGIVIAVKEEHRRRVQQENERLKELIEAAIKKLL